MREGCKIRRRMSDICRSETYRTASLLELTGMWGQCIKMKMERLIDLYPYHLYISRIRTSSAFQLQIDLRSVNPFRRFVRSPLSADPSIPWPPPTQNSTTEKIVDTQPCLELDSNPLSQFSSGSSPHAPSYLAVTGTGQGLICHCVKRRDYAATSPPSVYCG
jgi:hypothetical protein